MGMMNELVFINIPSLYTTASVAIRRNSDRNGDIVILSEMATDIFQVPDVLSSLPDGCPCSCIPR